MKSILSLPYASRCLLLVFVLLVLGVQGEQRHRGAVGHQSDDASRDFDKEYDDLKARIDELAELQRASKGGDAHDGPSSAIDFKGIGEQFAFIRLSMERIENQIHLMAGKADSQMMGFSTEDIKRFLQVQEGMLDRLNVMDERIDQISQVGGKALRGLDLGSSVEEVKRALNQMNQRIGTSEQQTRQTIRSELDTLKHAPALAWWPYMMMLIVLMLAFLGYGTCRVSQATKEKKFF